MKRILLLILSLMTLASTRAQEPTHITLTAGQTPIGEQMSEEQLQSVTHLTINGTLLDQDYTLIRTSLIDRLEELNLENADIETLPAHALERVDNNDHYYWEPMHSIIIDLPKNLRHMGDSCLFMNVANCYCKVTGHFPELGNAVLYGNGGNSENIDYLGGRFTIANGNPYCTVNVPHCTVNNPYFPEEYFYDIFSEYCIYSADRDTLYWGESADIPAGTKVIAGHAFEHQMLTGIEIPASVDSIGDRAFYTITLDVPTNFDGSFYIYNHAKTPQKLGKDVFTQAYSQHTSHLGAKLYVPSDAVDTYKATAGWSDFIEIYPIYTNIHSISADRTPAPAYRSTSGRFGTKNLSGQRVGSGYKGIVVRDGKKVVRK